MGAPCWDKVTWERLWIRSPDLQEEGGDNVLFPSLQQL